MYWRYLIGKSHSRHAKILYAAEEVEALVRILVCTINVIAPGQIAGDISA